MKKVLIITYYWPPAGGPGVQRVLKFAKFLPAFGWQPLILTVKDGEFPAIDDSLISEVDPSLDIFRTKSIEPFDLFKKLTGRKKDDTISTYFLAEKKSKSFSESLLKWLRINVVLPDAKIGWLPFAVKEGVRIVKEQNIDLIFSSSPPHTVQLIAAKIAKKTGIKWITDFRDPWLEIVYYQNLKRFFISYKIDRWLENKVLKQSNRVICISDSISDLFRTKLNQDKYTVIPNGFDPGDFESILYEKEDIFTITYTGVLADERIPYALIPALKKMQDEKMKFRLRLVGTVCSKFIRLLKENNLFDQTEFTGYVPHDQAIGYLLSSAILLLVIDDVPDNRGFLSGKIFDYLGSKVPVLAFGPVDGDAAKILAETSSGIMLDYNDHSAAYKWITKIYSQWPDIDPGFKFDVSTFNRKQLTGKLVEVFNEMVPNNKD